MTKNTLSRAFFAKNYEITALQYWVKIGFFVVKLFDLAIFFGLGPIPEAPQSNY
jgi:hypothetical protein